MLFSGRILGTALMASPVCAQQPLHKLWSWMATKWLHLGGTAELSRSTEPNQPAHLPSDSWKGRTWWHRTRKQRELPRELLRLTEGPNTPLGVSNRSQTCVCWESSRGQGMLTFCFQQLQPGAGHAHAQHTDSVLSSTKVYCVGQARQKTGWIWVAVNNSVSWYLILVSGTEFAYCTTGSELSLFLWRTVNIWPLYIHFMQQTLVQSEVLQFLLYNAKGKAYFGLHVELYTGYLSKNQITSTSFWVQPPSRISPEGNSSSKEAEPTLSMKDSSTFCSSL